MHNNLLNLFHKPTWCAPLAIIITAAIAANVMWAMVAWLQTRADGRKADKG
jgi:hypothetical protein